MSGMGAGAQSSIDYYEAEVCRRCAGTGEVGRGHIAHDICGERVRLCPECDGSGEPGRPPPHYLDGDYLRDARDGF